MATTLLATSLLPLLLVLLLLSPSPISALPAVSTPSISSTPRPPSPGAAARCIALQDRCAEILADRSVVCEPWLFIARQSQACRDLACSYCSDLLRIPRRMLKFCRSWGIRTWCSKLSPSPSMPMSDIVGPTPTGSGSGTKDEYNKEKDDDDVYPSLEPSILPSPEPMFTDAVGPTSMPKDGSASPTPSPILPARNCTWKGSNGQVVIPMTQVRPVSFWSRQGDALTWRAGDNRTSIDRRGSGEICLGVRVPSDGRYYVTALTSAPHWSEHNDFWIKLSAGLNLYSAKNHRLLRLSRRRKVAYFKAYQNLGRDRLAKVISGVNRRPHVFVSMLMGAGDRYEMCFSGRSSMFSVYSLVMIKCGGFTCRRTSPFIRNAMKSLRTSECSV